MASIVSKIFCLSNCGDVESVIQQYTRDHTCDVVPDFELRHLVDDDFIAGFCMRGEVTIIPLWFSYDLHFTVEKSVLTIFMSPTVYAGFGLPCVKVKEKPRTIYYRFRQDLRSPTFRRNSSVHQRLRRFFSSPSHPVESLRVPLHVLAPRPCLVHWNPALRTVHDSLQNTAPLGESLSRFLSPDTYCKVQTLTEILRFTSPVSLPFFFETPPDTCVPPSDSGPSTDCIDMRSRIDFAKARSAYHILSCLSTGIWPVSGDADDDDDDKSLSMNPCLVERGLAPSMTMEFRELEPVSWPIGNAARVHITGLFLPDHVSELETAVRRTIETHESDKRSFAFFATRPWPLEPSGSYPTPLISVKESSGPVAKLFLKLPKEEKSEDAFIALNFRPD